MRKPIIDQCSLPSSYRIVPEQTQDGSPAFAVEHNGGAPDEPQWIGVGPSHESGAAARQWIEDEEARWSELESQVEREAHQAMSDSIGDED